MSAPYQNDSCTRHDDQTLAEIESLPWVLRVDETDRDDATHIVVTELAAIRTDHEIHTLENCGVRVRGFSQLGHYGCRIFVSV